MSDLTDKERKLLESFLPGEYASLTILVRTKNLTEFMKLLKRSNLDMVIIPRAEADIEFYAENDDKGGIQ